MSLGDLSPVRMRADAQPQSGVVYYPMQAGIAWKLQREDGVADCVWRLSHANGLTYCFDASGLGRSIVASAQERIELTWEQKSVDKWSEWYVSSAKRVLADKVTHTITLKYKEPYSKKKSGSNDTLYVVGAQLESATLFAEGGQNLGQATYEVSRYQNAPEGRLFRVRDEQGRLREQYEYSEYRGQGVRMTPLDELREYCDDLCTPTPAVQCGENFCDRMLKNPPDCHQACNQLCGGACDKVVGAAGGVAYPEALKDGCVDECFPKCDADCKNPDILKGICNHSCRTSCMDMHFADALTGKPAAYWSSSNSEPLQDPASWMLRAARGPEQQHRGHHRRCWPHVCAQPLRKQPQMAELRCGGRAVHGRR